MSLTVLGERHTLASIKPFSLPILNNLPKYFPMDPEYIIAYDT